MSKARRKQRRRECRVRHAYVLLARQVLWSRFAFAVAVASAKHWREHANSTIGSAQLASAPIATDVDDSSPLIAYVTDETYDVNQGIFLMTFPVSHGSLKIAIEFLAENIARMSPRIIKGKKKIGH